MLVAIMVGVIIITYFAADIQKRAQIATLTSEHISEISIIEGKNINFTNNFLQSSVLLDSAREDRAYGNYHFDIALLFYNSALSEKNSSTFSLYTSRTIDNCTSAMENYLISHLNFLSAKSFFNGTKKYTNYEQYLELLDIYEGLTGSGARLTMLRYNASQYLKYLAENLTLVDGNVGFLTNVTDLMNLFNETMDLYEQESNVYNDYKKELSEYDIKGFDPIRHTYDS